MKTPAQINPELRRNLWLEFTTHRAIAMPVLIAVLALLVSAMGTEGAADRLARVAAYSFVAVVWLWGAKLTGASVVDEARARTWDAQRMSSITPWGMTWGKLLGAPAFAWYGGGILLLIFWLAGSAQSSAASLPIIPLTALLIGGALLLHAMALNASVLAARKEVGQRATGTLGMLCLILMIIVPWVTLGRNTEKPVQWWGLTIPALDFLLATVALFGAWAVLGAYRSMCNELEIRTTPWALPAFILCTAIYGAGFALHRTADIVPATACFGVMASGVVFAMTLTYALLFAEKGGASEWQRLRARVQARQWHRVLQELPLWLVALTLGLAMAIIASLTSGSVGGNVEFEQLLKKIGTAPIALVLFAVRDAAIFQYFALARQPRRVETTTLFYLFILYSLLPFLLASLGADVLAMLVFPPIATNSGYATLVMLVQASAAIALAYWRWRTVHAPDSAAVLPNKQK